MILIIDCFKLVKGAGKSIGIYNLTLNLVRNLVRIRESSEHEEIRECNIIVLGNKHNRQDFEIEGVQFQEMPYNPLDKIFCIYWELFLVKKYYKRFRGDRIIFPRGFAPFSRKLNDIIIVHDMIPFYYHKNFPGYFNRLENFYIMSRLKGSIKKCKKVITISNASKKEILDITHINSNKIAVIYNGCNRIMKEEIKEQDHSAKNGYLFAVTSSLPHKNAEGILKAYEKYCEACEKPERLLLLGVENQGETSISKKAAEGITYIKYIKENSRVHAAIKGAKAFLFLSLAEGFGFPPIEAMQLGVPVICSNLSSLPEVVGDSAVLVNPQEAGEVGDAIQRLLSDQKKQRELVEKGYENIKRFDWDKTAKEYWNEIYKL